MEFLKKHYEKVILSVVLLGLAAAAVYLPFEVSAEKQRLADIENLENTRPPKLLKPVVLTTNEAVLQRLQQSSASIFSGGNNLFNPVQWQRLPDGTLTPIRTRQSKGISALSVTNITPLNLIVTYNGQHTNSGAHMFTVTREADPKPSNRAPKSFSVTGVGTKSEGFILKELKPKDDPQEFTLEAADDRKVVVVLKDKPYSGVAGYTADMRYEASKQIFSKRRVGDRLTLDGETNKIVAITATNVTVEAPNRKRTVVPLKPSP